jgi:hypothetical protein
MQPDIKDKLISAENAQIQYIQKRLIKIGEAAFLIASVIKDREILRREIQEVSLLYIAAIRKAFDPESSKNLKMFFHGHAVYLDIEHRAHAISHLMQLGKTSGLISSMNVDIFLEQSSQILAEFRGLIAADNAAHGHAFFSSPINAENHASPISIVVNENKGIVNANQAQQPIKDIRDIKDISKNRKEKIVSFLKEHGQSSITDIAKNLPECSQKTVQRELNSMISEGVVKRAGDRRWSAYYI